MNTQVQDYISARIVVPAATLHLITELVQRLGGSMDESTDTGERYPAERLPDSVRPGRLLRAARLRADMTQTALAKAVGIPPSNISQMEHGVRAISAAKAELFAKILCTVPEHFLCSNATSLDTDTE